MSNNIKFTEEELEKIKVIRDKFEITIYQFGQLYIERLSVEGKIAELNKFEASLREEQLKLQKKEEELLNEIVNKYGEGSVSIETGEFIPKK